MYWPYDILPIQCEFTYLHHNFLMRSNIFPLHRQGISFTTCFKGSLVSLTWSFTPMLLPCPGVLWWLPICFLLWPCPQDFYYIVGCLNLEQSHNVLFIPLIWTVSTPTWVLLSHYLACMKSCTKNIDIKTRRLQYPFFLYIIGVYMVFS